jgi:PAS domain S-box-containing protein
LRIEQVERKRAEQAQRESEDKLLQIIETGPNLLRSGGAEDRKAEVQPGFMAQVQAILNVLPTYTWYAAPRGALTFVNTRTADYLGIPNDHPLRFGIDIGATWDEWIPLLHPDDQEKARKYWSNCMRTGEAGELSYRVRSGQGDYRWFLTRFEPLRASDGTLLLWVGATLDIEELMRAQEALRESERSARSAIDGIAGLVSILAPNGEVETVNRQVFEYFGQSLEELKNWEATDAIHPEDLPHVAEIFMRALACGIPFQHDQRLRRFDGEYRWFENRGVPVRDDAGRIVRWYVLMTDIEDRKRALAQLEQMQSDFAHINRVSMMGELTASLAHEVKQPIASSVINAKTCVRWLRRDVPDIAEACEAASRMVYDATRAADILDRVRSLYRRDSPQRELVDVNEIIREMIVMLQDQANRSSIVIRTECDPGLARIPGDRVQLQQVLMNLMLNGIEAMTDTGGELTVTSKNTAEGPLLISVSDSGVGIAPDRADRIFEAFFTTKPQGTGMGLSISRRIIESHGGRLWASANSERGTTFQFTLASSSSAA